VEQELLEILGVPSSISLTENILTAMQNDRRVPVCTEPRKQGNLRELVDLPATPSFSFADANFIVDIEVHADQLLAYIDKLTSLADRACNTAMRQTETAQWVEKNRQIEITNLREQLDFQKTQCQEQQLALVRVEQESKAQIAVLESQLRLSEIRQEQAEKDKELKTLRVEKATLTSRLAEVESNSKQAPAVGGHEFARGREEVADSKHQLAKRDEIIHRKNQAIKQMELDFRAKVSELEQRLSEIQLDLQSHEVKLKEKDAVIQMTAAKELEMGNLIQRLSAECAALSKELQEKNRRLIQIEPKKAQPLNDGKIWRRVIGRLQEEPQ
jgi:DNA repair exonuclease SbcCD ATPase subunit